MSLLARRRIGDDDTGSTWADRVGDGGEERVSIDRHVGVLGDEFADFGGDSVDECDHERDERREHPAFCQHLGHKRLAAVRVYPCAGAFF